MRPTKRTKGFYRALKRGELWLIGPYNLFGEIGIGNEFRGNRFKEIHFDRNCPSDQAYITYPLIPSIDICLKIFKGENNE